MIGSNIIYLHEVDSTNNYAAEQFVTKCLKEDTVFVAARQNAGRGQKNNHWESEPGKNVTMSLLHFPVNLEAQHQFQLSKALSLAMTDLLSLYLSGVTIKWPNDIYAGNGKIAGILIENSVTGQWISRSIIGIGLNVNQQVFLSDAPNPVSMSQLMGCDLIVNEVVEMLCHSIDQRLLQLSEGAFRAIDEAYLSRLYRFNQPSLFEDQEGEFTGTIKDIDPYGRLMIEDTSHKMRLYAFKEVTFRV